MDQEEIKQKVWILLHKLTQSIGKLLKKYPNYNASLSKTLGIIPAPRCRADFVTWSLLRDKRTGKNMLRPGALESLTSNLYNRKNMIAFDSDSQETCKKDVEKETYIEVQIEIQELCELLKAYIKKYPEKAYCASFVRDMDINLCPESTSGDFADYLVKILLKQNVLEYTGLKGPRNSNLLQVVKDKTYTFQDPAPQSKKGISAGEALAWKTLEEFVPELEIIHQKKWKDCRDKRELPFDLYDPENGIVLEIDGAQHFCKNNFFGGKKGFKYIKKHDTIKNKYIGDNDLKMVRIDSTTRNVRETIISVYQNLDRLPTISLFGDNYNLCYCDKRIPKDFIVLFDQGLNIF